MLRHGGGVHKASQSNEGLSLGMVGVFVKSQGTTLRHDTVTQGSSETWNGICKETTVTHGHVDM